MTAEAFPPVIDVVPHLSLSPEREAQLRAAWEQATEAAAALRAGVAYWTEFFDVDAFWYGWCDPQDRAAEVMQNRADEALFALAHGEREH